MPIMFRCSRWNNRTLQVRGGPTTDELGILVGGLADTGVDIFHVCTLCYARAAFKGSYLPLAI